MNIKISKNEWAKIKEGACVCNQDEESFCDISVMKIDVGTMGEFEVDTYLSLGDDPKILSEFYATDKDDIIFMQKCEKKAVNFCPFCGRRLRK